jgi:hypothetical protein
MTDSLNLALLQSNEFLTFAQRAVGIFSNNETNTKFGLAPFVIRATNAYNSFNKAFERESKNPFTNDLALADAERDTAFIGFRNYMVACSHRNTSGWNEAAGRILEIIRKHGWRAAAFGYKAETAALTNVIDEVKTKCASDLTLLSATEWFAQLETAQTAFEQVQNASINRDTSNQGPTIRDTRPVLTHALRALLSITDLQFSATPDDAILKTYVNALNELIGVTMTSVRANATRQENEKKKQGTPATENQ